MIETEMLYEYLHRLSGLSRTAFDLSAPHWQLRTYKGGELYNEYKSVCKYLGFVIEGVFRIYRRQEPAGLEKNLSFFLKGQLMISKSFIQQTACEYFTESMTESTILFLHHDNLQRFYQDSQEWERFGRKFAEAALVATMSGAEGFLFLRPETRYSMLVEQYPDLLRHVPLYHIASYLGIEGPSLSRIRRRMQNPNP